MSSGIQYLWIADFPDLGKMLHHFVCFLTYQIPVEFWIAVYQHELGQGMFLIMLSLTGTNHFQSPFNYLPFSQKKWLSKSSISFDKHWTFQPSTWHMLIQVTVKLIMTQEKFKIIFKHWIHMTPSQYSNVKPLRQIAT